MLIYINNKGVKMNKKKLVYKKPKLVTHGKLNDITAGGGSLPSESQKHSQ